MSARCVVCEAVTTEPEGEPCMRCRRSWQLIISRDLYSAMSWAAKRARDAERKRARKAAKR